MIAGETAELKDTAACETPRGFYESPSTSMAVGGGQPENWSQAETLNSNRWSMSVHHSACSDSEGERESANHDEDAAVSGAEMDVERRQTRSANSSFLSMPSPPPPLMSPASVYRAWISQGLSPHSTRKSSQVSNLHSATTIMNRKVPKHSGADAIA